MNRLSVLLLTALLQMLVPVSAMPDDLPAGYVALQVCNKNKVDIKLLGFHNGKAPGQPEETI